MIILKQITTLVEKSKLPYATKFLEIESDAQEIDIVIKDFNSEKIEFVSHLESFLLNIGKNIKIPFSTIGTIFRDPYELSYYIKEIIDNYEHYSETANIFSKDYFKTVNAKVLIQCIAEKSR